MTKSNYPNFSIIIPTYNGHKLLTACLDSVQIAIKSCHQSSFEIIIVDNGSSEKLKSQNLKLKIIRHKTNLGFATAVNQGIKKSKYSYVCLLNNDLILDKNWFKILSAVIFKNPQITTFCGTVLSRDGTKIESQGLRFFMSGRCENINNGHSFISSLRGVKRRGNLDISSVPVWGSSAAAVIYLKKAIQEVGLFDESFFAYIEDVDLSYRLQKNNHSTLLVPTAISYHLGGGTSNSMGLLRQYYTLRNWIKLIFKNYTVYEIITNSPGIFIERLRNLSYLLKSL